MSNDGNDKAEPDSESLRTQLSELNQRARAYTAQQWQVPFAYLAVTGVSLGSIKCEGMGDVTLAAAFVVAAVLGILVYLHMLGNRDGAKRAVENIQETEDLLNLRVTAKYRGNRALLPLEAMVLVTTAAYFAGAGFHFFSDACR
jgi:hypothetical protein